jgi:acyl carrier protein
MQSERVLKKVLAIAADVFQVDESSIGPASSPDSIETWDSLHHLSFVLALEQEFGVQISPEEIERETADVRRSRCRLIRRSPK